MSPTLWNSKTRRISTKFPRIDLRRSDISRNLRRKCIQQKRRRPPQNQHRKSKPMRHVWTIANPLAPPSLVTIAVDFGAGAGVAVAGESDFQSRSSPVRERNGKLLALNRPKGLSARNQSNARSDSNAQ